MFLLFRDEWGKIYQTFFTSGRNRKAMDMLEKVAVGAIEIDQLLM